MDEMEEFDEIPPLEEVLREEFKQEILEVIKKAVKGGWSPSPAVLSELLLRYSEIKIKRTEGGFEQLCKWFIQQTEFPPNWDSVHKVAYFLDLLTSDDERK